MSGGPLQIVMQGFDIEGCPNSNPFAHSPCGFRVKDRITNLEWLGLFSLQYLPFHSCLIPKKVTKTLQALWATNTTDVSDPICAPFLPILISYIPYPYSAMILSLPFAFVMFTTLGVIFCPLHKKRKHTALDDQDISMKNQKS